jgi:membrane-associated phospholipid phosphatase
MRTCLRIEVGLLSLVFAAPAAAQSGEGAAHSEPHGLGFIGRSLVLGVTAPVRSSGRDWLALGVGAAGIAVLSTLDGEVRDIARRNHGEFADAVARGVKPFGQLGSGAVLAGFLAAGVVLGDARALGTAVDGISGTILASALLVPALQSMTGRARPWRGEGEYSFHAFSGRHSLPSGHAAQAFVVASVIAEHYDAAWVDIAAWSAASLVALSRIYHDAHHFSDVTAGALIGGAIGRALVRADENGRRPGAVQPSAGFGTVGLTIRW